MLAFFSLSCLMRPMALLAAHRKSCSDVPRGFLLFKLIVIKDENPYLRSRANENNNRFKVKHARFEHHDAQPEIKRAAFLLI